MGRPYAPIDMLVAVIRRDDDTEGYPMSINRTRGSLYKLARILGDVQAVRKGRVGKRIGRRVVGRYAGRGMGRLFR